MRLIDYFSSKDLNSDLQLIAEELGEGVAFALAEHFAGVNLYISARPLQKAKERQIIAKFNQGTSVLRLAKESGFSMEWVYQILRKGRDAASASKGNTAEQADLF